MATLNEKLRDAAIDRQIDLGRYANNLVRRVIGLFNRTDVDLVARLTAALDRLPPASTTVKMLDSSLTSLRELNRIAHDDAEKLLTGELRSLTAYEIDYQMELFGRAFKGFPLRIGIASVNAEQAFAAVLARPFQGRLLKEWTQSLEAGKATRIRDAVRMGVIEGQATADIVRRVRGTRANGYSDGIIALDRRHAETIVRTAISHTAAVTRDRFYKANDDLVRGKMWVSTLDKRTTHECGIRDGLEYDMLNQPVGHDVPWGAGPGRLHYGCRSVSSPSLVTFRELGLDLDEFTPTQRASLDGPVAGSTGYLDWLERQGAARQDEILGPTRGKLLRAGQLDASRLWDDKGNYLTLDQMRARDGVAFERAGL